jgi:SnoaL-like polyketide cyclase
LEIDVQHRHVTEDAILVGVVIRGTHLGGWRGLPPTGRRVEVPLCGVYTFDVNDRLAGEKIYYDRGTVLRTGRFPRTAERIGTDLDFGDSSRHDCARFSEKTAARLMGFIEICGRK